jgi:hypothetical protein
MTARPAAIVWRCGRELNKVQNLGQKQSLRDLAERVKSVVM